MSDGLRDAFMSNNKIDISDEEINRLFRDWDDEPNTRKPFGWLEPECHCGSWKTYGRSVSNSLHSDWCPVKQ